MSMVMMDSPTLLSGRLSRTTLTWLIVAVLVTTPLEALGLDQSLDYVTFPLRMGSLSTILILLRTGRVGPIGCGRLCLAQGLITMMAWSLLIDAGNDRLALAAIAYGTILSIFALLIAPKKHRHWWATVVVGVVLIPPAIRLIPEDLTLFMQTCAALLVHSVAVAVLDIHTNKAEQAGAMASIDSLTGLFNRRETIKRLTAHIDLADTDAEASSLLLVDLDNFKRINDTRGHMGGDAVLVEVADVLAAETRPIDTVCRWGGEEFLVLIPEAGQETARQAAERLRAAIAATGVTASFGVAEVREGDTINEWIRRADFALYTAKNEGRNRVSTNIVQMSRGITQTPAALHGTAMTNGSTLV